MMNKKGALVLRDMVFMMMIVSGIFVLAGIFVSDMADNYSNTNMTDEWGIKGTNTLANSTFYETGESVKDVSDDMKDKSTGIFSLIDGAGNVLKGIGSALFMVITAPTTISDLVYTTLLDAGTPITVAEMLKYMILIVLWGIIIFTIASAFLRGGKL